MLFSKHFHQNFIIPEFRHLAGKRFGTLVMIFVIFFASILAIGFGQTFKQYLGERMNSPFIRFVPLTLDRDDYDKIEISKLNMNKLRDSFNYAPINKINFQYFNLKTKEKSISNGHRSQKLNTNSELFDYLKNNSDLLLTQQSKLAKAFKNDQFGVLVTKNLLKDLGYSEKIPPYIKVVPPSGIVIPIQVAGVVKKLPYEVELLITEETHETWKRNRFNVNKSDHQSYLLTYSPKDISLDTISGFEKKPALEPVFGDGVVYQKEEATNASALFKQLEKEGPNNLFRLYQFDRVFNDNERYEPRVNKLTVPFKSLDSVQAFQNYLKDEFKNISLSMSALKAKRNFQIFSKISNGLSYTLIGFSALLVIFFIVSIINGHFEKNKQNLGTLKAFGLSNNAISNIYTLIAGSMVIIAFLAAFGLTTLVGKAGTGWAIELIGLSVDKGQVEFTSYPFLWLFCGLSIIPIGAVYITLNYKIRNQTPGDLVYGRV